MDYDRTPELGPCCICERTGDDVRVLVQLTSRAPIPGHGWGCFVCNIPSDGAVAVICEECAIPLEREGAPPITSVLKFACRGYPGTEGRVPYADLTGEFRHRDVPHGSTRHQEQ